MMDVKGFFLCLVRCWRKILGLLVPLALSPLLIVVGGPEAKCAYAILWLACYFVLEPIPIPASALLPILLYPLLGILSTDETCKLYFKDIIVMFMGAMILAASIEHCNLHKRIALKTLLTLGTSVRWLMIGFIIVSTSLSMWLVNTATTAMMAPIVDALIDELEGEKTEQNLSSKQESEKNSFGMTDVEDSCYQIQDGKESEKKPRAYYVKLRKALMLSVAYSSTCGGTGSAIGTGANFVLLGLMEKLYPKTNQLTFSTWLLFNVPTMILCVISVFLVLQTFYVGFQFKSNEEEERRIKNVLKKKYDELGPMRFHEYGVMFIFSLLVITWLFRNPRFIEGWSSKFDSAVTISNATPAVAACLLLFLIPADPRNYTRSKPLLDWKTAEKKMPWGILLLFGSGLAVAEGAEKSGLTIWIAENLQSLNVLSSNAILVVLCLLTAFLTEVLTNMTTATLLLPVVNQMAVAIGVNPLFFMLPVAICCSFSFMLPVGNPPCAIVYQAGGMNTIDLIKPGIFLNFICCGLEILMINTLGTVIFDFSAHAQPLNHTLSNNFLLNNSTNNSFVTV